VETNLTLGAVVLELIFKLREKKFLKYVELLPIVVHFERTRFGSRSMLLLNVCLSLLIYPSKLSYYF